VNEVSYWTPPDENPNFISRPPDPGVVDLFKTVGWESLYHSPFHAVQRWSELTLEKNIPTSAYPVRKLDPDELNQKYGLGGQLKFDEPMYEAAAQVMYRRKVDENDRAYLIASGQNTGMRSAGSFGVGMAATLLDPINVAAMFIPVVGEARVARFAQQFGGGALKQRLIQGAVAGGVGAAMVEPFILLPALQEQANYSIKDSALNLGFGAALGGMLHAGLGAIGDRLRRVKPRDADTLFESALNNVLKDEPVTAPAKVAEFIDELNPERIQSAAYRLEDGTILTGKGHPGIIMEYGETHLHGAEDGFVTDQGRFVSRQEAYDIAKVADQFSPEYKKIYGGIEANPDPEGQAFIRDGASSEEIMGLRGADGFDEMENRQAFLEKQDMNALGIPRRDAKGKFLSKEARLELLDQKLQNDAVEAARAKQENGDKKVIKDTKENSSRLPKDDIGMTSDHAKDTQLIDQDTAEIEKSLDLTPEQKTTLRDEIKSEVGDQPGREKGIVEGIKCIIRNLV
jgi:hypothetical protein